jgi:hypothetical protein
MGFLVVAVVAGHSQADLIQFKRERSRWPREDELDAWNRELHGRRLKTKRVAVAASAVKSADRAYREHVTQAERALQAAHRAHANTIAGARRELATAQKSHDLEIAQATSALAAWRDPGRGNRITVFKSLELYQHALVIRRQVVPILHVHAAVAGNYLTIQIAGGQDITKFERGEVPAALQFSSQVAVAVAAEMAFQEERPRAIPAAEQYLRQVSADTGAIEAARVALTAAERDGTLLAPIQKAEQKLAGVQADRGTLDTAQSELRTQQESAVEPIVTASPPRWLPRTSNAITSIVGIVLTAIIVGGVGALITHSQPHSAAIVREVATPTSEAPTVTEAPLVVATPSVTATPASPSPTNIPAPTVSPPPAQAPVPTVVGFGATDADWNAHHSETPGFAPHAVYDPDPSLPRVNGHTGSRYYAVNHMNRRVLNYSMSLRPGTPVGAAKTQALQEFPTDVTVVWFRVRDTCAQMEVKSATLGAALADPTIGDPQGLAIIEFSTHQPDGTSIYSAANVDDVILTLGSYATPNDAPAC